MTRSTFEYEEERNDDLLRSPAPQFYLTPSSAYTIIQRHRHRRGRRKEEQMRQRASRMGREM